MFFQQLVFYFILGRDVILWLTKKKKTVMEKFLKKKSWGDILIVISVPIKSSLRRKGMASFFILLPYQV